MLTFDELVSIRDKLVNGDINLQFAQSQYWNGFKEGQRSWNTKDWKERRAALIKDQCEICGSKETLTLQHQSHPKRYADYLREVTRANTNDYIKTNPELNTEKFRDYILSRYDYLPVPLCTTCKSSNPYERVRKIPKYRCLTCKQEFETPEYKSVDELIAIFHQNEEAIEVRDKYFVSKDKWRSKNNLGNIRYWFNRELAKTKDAEAIEKRALLLYLDDCIEYCPFRTL